MVRGDAGTTSLLVTMEPKEPTTEESVPVVEDEQRSISEKTEISPTGGLLEVDATQTATVEVGPNLVDDSGLVTQGRKEDSAGLQVVQGNPDGGQSGAELQPEAEDGKPASGVQTTDQPNEVTPYLDLTHCYRPGDTVDGTVYRIDTNGVWLHMGGVKVLIPADDDQKPQFR